MSICFSLYEDANNFDEPFTIAGSISLGFAPSIETEPAFDVLCNYSDTRTIFEEVRGRKSEE